MTQSGVRSSGQAQHLGVEGQLGVEGGADVGGLAEAVALALEREVHDGQALGPHGLDDHLGLGRRDDLVVEALEHGERAVDAVDVEQRRAGLVDVLGVGPRADEAVEVAGLELVRVPRQRAEVGDAVVAGAGRERVLERRARRAS